jgi:ankyrin repeat protein
MAAQFGHVEVAILLADLGAALDSKKNDSGSTPLIIAAQNGHVEVARMLLDRGVCVDQTKTSGASALHMSGARLSVAFSQSPNYAIRMHDVAWIHNVAWVEARECA